MSELSSFYLRFFGLSEAKLSNVLSSILGTKVIYLIQPDRYELVLELRTSKAKMNSIKPRLIAHLGDYLIGTGRVNSIERIVGKKLIKRRLSITGAESLTAGMFQSTLGNVPGISAVFPGGFVTYSNHAKHQLLGIPSEVIDKYGVVSQPVAKWMAKQSRQIMNTDLSVSFTGAAGPSSLEGQPAGTVWIGLAIRNRPTQARLYHLLPLYEALNGFKSEDQATREIRDGIRLLSVKTGLKMVNNALIQK